MADRQECLGCCPIIVLSDRFILKCVGREVARRWKGSGERLEIDAGVREAGTELEHEILVRLVQVKNGLTELGRRCGADC